MSTSPSLPGESTLASPSAMSPEQISALRHQIHAFKLISNGSPVPDAILQGIKPAPTAEVTVVSSEGPAEAVEGDNPTLLVDVKLNQNQELIKYVSLCRAFIVINPRSIIHQALPRASGTS